MTLEQRIARAERLLKMFLRRGRKYRNEFRESFKMLVNAQIATEDQIKRTDKQIEALGVSQAKTEQTLDRLAATQALSHARLDETLDRLAASQAKTEQTLDRLAATQASSHARLDETLDRLAASQAKTEQTLDRLAASQAKTDETLDRFIKNLGKDRNGNFSD